MKKSSHNSSTSTQTWFQNNKISLLVLLFLIIAIVPAVYPLLHPGFFVTDDGDWMIIRFTAFHQALVNGQFPVRFLPRLYFDYGYPVADFLYPGFMYLAEPLHLIHFGFINSIKILCIVSFVGSGIFTFLWLRKFFNIRASFAGSIVSIYTPYHLYDMYRRGSIGEVLALAVIPFIFWQLERGNILLTSLGIGLLLLSHNTLAFLFLPMLFVYSIFRKPFRSLLLTCLVFALGVVSAAFFWIPALYDLQFTVFSQTQISEWQKYFADVSIIGILTILILVISIVIIFMKKDKLLGELKKQKGIIYFFVALDLLALFLSSNLSTIVWSILPISFIQFPFRLLSISVVASGFLAAFLLSLLRGKASQIVVVILVLVSITLAYPYISNVQYTNRDEGYYTTNEDSTTVKNEYLPTSVKQRVYTRPVEKIAIIHGTVTEQRVTPNAISFTIYAPQSTTVTVNTLYFPGWKATLDGESLPIHYMNPKGVIELTVPKGKHHISATFGETPLRFVSDIISLLSVVSLFILIKMNKRNSTVH